MTRVGFVLQVRPDRLDDYRAAHAAVWPDMLDALSRHGWHNYSLFLRDDGTLFGYVEVAGTFDDALAGMASEEVNLRWQAAMAPFFTLDPGSVGDTGRTATGVNERAADTMMEQLTEVFHLD
jgi:L-rhamnose mutarotase